MELTGCQTKHLATLPKLFTQLFSYDSIYVTLPSSWKQNKSLWWWGKMYCFVYSAIDFIAYVWIFCYFQIRDRLCLVTSYGPQSDGQPMSPPRLTGALRSFSTVSKQEDFTEEVYDLKVRLTQNKLHYRPYLINLCEWTLSRFNNIAILFYP